MSTGKKALLLSFLLFLTCISVGIWNSAQKQSYQLPDGTTVTLLGVTQGTNALYYSSRRIERLLAHHIPPTGIKFLGFQLRAPIAVTTHDFDSIFRPANNIAWVELRGTNLMSAGETLRFREWKIFAKNSGGRV